MSFLASRLIVALLLLTISGAATAQSSDPARPARTKTNPNANKSARDPEAEKAAKERRAQARSLLVSLASDARNFNDQTLRARCLARIADALWEVDPEESRTLFQKAWEAAALADKEGQRRLDEEIRRQKAKTGGGFATTLPPNLRGEVLRLASRRNRALGEELLEKLRADKQEEANDATKQSKRGAFDLAEVLRQRLSLARQLLESGDVERAIQFADQALGTVSMQGIDFLSFLRSKDAAVADQRFAAMMSNALNTLRSDANTVSLLSSYLFTPHAYVIFSASGTSSSQTDSAITPPDVSPELRAAFFLTASEILLRPLLPPNQDESTSGIEGKYLVIKRLMPLFELLLLPRGGRCGPASSFPRLKIVKCAKTFGPILTLRS